MKPPSTASAASMDKSFDPKTVEPRWRSHWEKHDIFRAEPGSSRPPFCMVIPPPNITGRLHVGHGLNNALQDVLARWRRMSGDDVLWVPGSDHASIATHVMIERQLEKEGITRQQLGREKFLERAWAWKQKYGGEIADQLRQLGASCDWSRERFTMDPGLSRAVREVFVRLYEKGLIYRDRYLINWCPRCGTAVSDLEVVHKEMLGKIWTVRYQLEGGGEIRVATTRPETILGDAAVAVHPDDARYRDLVGRRAILPVLGRMIPVVADSFVDPAFGTGAVKVTPAHDPNDFLAGRRLGLEPIVVMDETGRMNAAAGPFAGLDRFECRTRLLEQLRNDGALIEEKDHMLSVGRCQRCDTIVEPMISLQWFVRMEPLAAPALEAVESGRIAVVPDQWKKTYYEWMRNIRDWCISRQLWWGHRIPAWYCAQCGAMIVSREDPVSCACGGRRLEQDPDVLDTWFSSGLWAFSTLGWPESTPELRRYYPTTVLVTGYDIIFFWVARMVMMGLEFMEDVPFHTVFFNGMVRDAKGEKMSKMKGNTVDLFDLLDTYGTDAVRFTCAALTSPGSDVAMSPGRLEGSRAFANKIWNAVRFARPHLDAAPAAPPAVEDGLGPADRWILSRCSRVAGEVNEALEAFRFDEASAKIYQFAWHELCDWYLELSKQPLSSANAQEADASRAVLRHVMERVIRMLHPFMPFITEELWQALPRVAGDPVSIALCAYPLSEPAFEDPEAESALATLIDAVTMCRNLRAEKKVAIKEPVRTWIQPANEAVARSLAGLEVQFKRLTRTSELQIGVIPAEVASVSGVSASAALQMAIQHEGRTTDVGAERARLQKEIEAASKELSVHEVKLGNEAFVSRARPEAVEKVRSAHGELSERIKLLKSALSRLGA
ncbi:MAG TPA: valine--tRNA ligase [Patescibacteria group bacterium]|nr:valine--tRNA ligase [Patescibacteria group bacterium]